MRAVWLRLDGGATKLIEEDVPQPTPGMDELLIQVSAAAGSWQLKFRRVLSRLDRLL